MQCTEVTEPTPFAQPAGFTPVPTETVVPTTPTALPADYPADNPPIPKNDFLAIATQQLSRGFKYLTPLYPNTKTPAIRGYNKRAATTPEDIKKWSEKFPDFGCGIVCRRGIGTSLVFDCDSEGLIEQIESETGLSFPMTLTVASRLNVPYKRHHVFTQTAYSCRHLPKSINARDVWGRYDCKVNGQAVGIGTIHEKTQLPYTVVHEVTDFPIGIPIPDKLVDWFVMDRQRCKENKDWRPKKKIETEKTETKTDESAVQQSLIARERRFIQHGLGEGHPKIPKGERYANLCSQAGTMISRGIPRRGIESALIAFAQDECEDGRNYARQHKTEIHRIAFSETLRFGGTWVGEIGNGGKIVFELQPVTRHRLLVDCARSFPNGITADERYALFAKALEGAGFALDKRLPQDREEIRRVRLDAGFTTKGGRRHARWYRVDTDHRLCNINQDQGDIGIHHPIARRSTEDNSRRDMTLEY